MFAEEKGSDQAPEPLPPVQLTAEDEEKHRPPNAFILFDRAMRQEVALQNPEFSQDEVSRAVGRLWQMASEATKTAYRQQAHALRELWQHLHPGETPETRKRKNPVQQTRGEDPIRIRVILDGGEAIPHSAAAVEPPLLVPRLDDRL